MTDLLDGGAMKKTILILVAVLAPATAFATDYKHCSPGSASFLAGPDAAQINKDGQLFVGGGRRGDSYSMHETTNQLYGKYNYTMAYTMHRKDGKPDFLDANFSVSHDLNPGVKDDGVFFKPFNSVVRTHYKYDQKDLCYVDRISFVEDKKEIVTFDRATCDRVMAAVKGKEQQIAECSGVLSKVLDTYSTAKSRFQKEGSDYKVGMFGSMVSSSATATNNDVLLATALIGSCQMTLGLFQNNINSAVPANAFGFPAGMMVPPEDSNNAR
jgi:hypothetical protein